MKGKTNYRIVSVILAALLLVSALLTVQTSKPAVATSGWPGDPAVNVPVCTAADNQDTVRTCSDGSGGMVTVWQDKRTYATSATDIYAQRISADGVPLWTADGVAVTNTAGDQLNPAVFFDSSSTSFIVVWQENGTDSSGDIWAQKLDINGARQWGANGVPVCTILGSEQSAFRYCPYPGSTATIGADAITATIATAGDAFNVTTASAGVVIVTPGSGAPTITYNPVTYTYTVTADADNDKVTITALAAGASGTVKKTTGTGTVTFAEVAGIDANDNIVLPATIAAPDLTSTFTLPDLSESVPLSPGLIVAWQDKRNGNYDIYAQKIDSSGAVKWATNGVPVCTDNTADQKIPRICSDNAGGAIVVWQDSRTANSVWGQRIDPSGNPLWATDGISLVTTVSNPVSPPNVSLSTDFSGGAVMAWLDNRAGSSASNLDIYAQKFNSSGVPQWTPNTGVVICNASAEQSHFTAFIPSSAPTSAVIVWRDYRTGVSNNFDIYAQKIDLTTGAPVSGWTANGVPVCANTSLQESPRLMATPAGPIIAWEDSRSGSKDIYAQKLNSSGVPQWTADGIPVSTAANNQMMASLVYDNADGVIAAWADYRASTSVADIYAQRIFSTGSLSSAPSPVVDLALDLNPAAGYQGLHSKAVIAGLSPVGDFTCEVFVIAGTQPVHAVDVFLNFASAQLEVISLTVDTTSLGEITNNNCENAGEIAAANTLGQVDFSLMNTSGAVAPTGTFRIGTVNFHRKAGSGSTGINFNTTLLRKSEVGYAGTSVLDELLGATVTSLMIEPGGLISPITVGVPTSITVTIREGGVTKTDYVGTVHFTSTDTQAILPVDYTFTAGDAGIHTFTNGITFQTPGNQTVTITDIANNTITGTSGGITVQSTFNVSAGIPVPQTELSADSDTILLDKFNSSTSAQVHGSADYIDSIPNLGKALRLPAGSWLRYIPNGLSQIATAGSIEFFVAPTAYSTSLVTLQWNYADTPPAAGYVLGLSLEADGKISYGVWNGQGDGNLKGATTIPLDTWSHICIAWDGSGSNIYVNGQTDASTATKLWPSNPQYLYIGGWGISGTTYFDELRISKAARVKNLVTGGSGTDYLWSAMTGNTTVDLYDIWVNSASDAFAVGNSGTILHYNGSAWSAMTSNTTASLSGVWGSSASDVYAVGGNGTVMRYNGSAWSPVNTGHIFNLAGVWGSSPADIFAVGQSNNILHYNGSGWSLLDSSMPTGTNFDGGIWGTSSSDVFANTSGGATLHYNGSTWSAMGTARGSYLDGIWGTSSSDVFTVGYQGGIVRYNGSSWSDMTSNTNISLWDIWGSSASDVFAVGDTGTVMHYDGSTWAYMPTSTNQKLAAIAGSSATDVFAVGFGGVILHYNGGTTPATGSISGTIYESNGSTPISGATVNAYIYANRPFAAPPAGTATTNANGQYTIGGLAAGDYRVSAVAANHERRYYASTPSNYWSQAQKITLAEGEAVTGKNMNLGPGGTISGTITAAAGGTQLTDVSLVASVVGVSGPGLGLAISGTGGAYTLDGLPYGTYYVQSPISRFGTGDDSFIPEYYNNKPISQNPSPDTVTVASGSNPTGIDFSLEAGGTISGHIYKSSDSSPIASAFIWVYDYSSISGSWVYRGSAITDTAGYYQTMGLPAGQYGIRAGDTPGVYAYEWYNNVPFKDSATAVSVTVGADTPDKDFTLDTGGSISGTVTADAGGAAISNVNMQAFDYTTGKWVNAVNTGTNGTYTIPNLPAGTYRLRACPTCNGLAYLDEYYDNAFSSASAQQVTVTAGAVTSGKNFALGTGGTIQGTVKDHNGQTITTDASVGSIDMSEGWHKFVYRFEEGTGASIARAAFKAPGNTDWRWFSTTEHTLMRVSPDLSAQSGLTLTTKKNNWGTNHPNSHTELVKCVDQDATPDTGWYGQSVVSVINQEENIHGNDDNFTAYYETYIYCDIPGTWQFSTDSDDASEIVIDDQVVASWYQGHRVANRWERKIVLAINDYTTNNPISSGVANLDGTFSITSVPPGTYRITALAPGYITEHYQETPNYSSATAVILTSGETKTNIDFTLQAGGTISGTIVKEDGSTPAPGVRVNVYTYDATANTWSTAGSGITDAQGHYTTSLLPSGQYYLRLYAPKYIGNWYGDVFSPELSTQVTVTAPADTPDKNFKLEPGAYVSGRVQSGTNPISNAQIKVIDYSTLNGNLLYLGWATTDSQGYYVTTGVPTGNYAVYVSASGYISEYCNNTYYRSQAASLALTAPNELPGKDFTLETGGSISGTVTADVGGAGIASLHLYATDVTTNDWMSGASTGSNGTYTISGLPAGNYYLRACASCSGLPYADEYYDDTYNRNLAQPITVTGTQNTPDKNISLAPGGSISGKVTAQTGGANLPNVSVDCRRATDSSGDWWWGATTDSQGNYTLGGLPYGTYIVRSPSSGRWGTGDDGYLLEHYNNQPAESSANTVTVDATHSPTDIDFALDQGGTISGTVWNANHTATLANISVECHTPNGKTWYNTTTGSQGAYTITGLPLGNYYVRAPGGSHWASGDDNYVIETYSEATSEGSASQVTVASGNNPTGIDFTLAVGGSISGNVKKTDNSPIVNMHLYATDSTTGVWTSGAQTDTLGNYTLHGLPAGNYKVRACASCSNINYIDEWWDNTTTQNNATAIAVTGTADTPGKDFVLDPGGSISGRVTRTSDGAPVSGATVTPYTWASLGIPGPWSSPNSTTTDSSGYFTVYGLPPGDYGVRATATGLATEWYCDKYFPTSGAGVYNADKVTVVASQDRPSTDFSLEAGGSISGYVKVNTNPLNGAIVSVYNVSDIGSYGSISTNSSGYYQFTGLATGDYAVRVMAGTYAIEWFSNVSGEAYVKEDATAVSVNAPTDTGNINFNLVPGGCVSGKVTSTATGGNIAGARIYLYDSQGRVMTGAISGADGTYTTFCVIGGQYTVRAMATGYNTEWYNNVYTQSQATAVTVVATLTRTSTDFSLEAEGVFTFAVPLAITTSNPVIGTANATFGVKADATDGFDTAYDDVVPPAPVADGIWVYFSYTDNTPTEANKLSASYIPPADELSWTLKVMYKKDGPATGNVSIAWNAADIAAIPSQYISVLLRNSSDTATLADMRAVNSYTFSVNVPDEADYLITTFIIKLSRAVTFNLELKTGWNLVSLPVDPGTTDPAIILQDVGYYSIYTWDPVAKGYVKPVTEGMVVGKGYWVFVLNNVTQVITGLPVNTFTFNAPSSGWYLIGSLYSSATFTADPAGNAYTKVYEWNAAGKSYTSPLTTIAAGTGNWFLALGACSVTVNPSP